MLELMNHRSLTSTDRHSMTKKAKAKGSQVRPRGMDRLARAAPTMEAPTTEEAGSTYPEKIKPVDNRKAQALGGMGKKGLVFLM